MIKYEDAFVHKIALCDEVYKAGHTSIADKLYGAVLRYKFQEIIINHWDVMKKFVTITDYDIDVRRHDCHEYLAVITNRGKVGLLDIATGRVVVPPLYDRIKNNVSPTFYIGVDEKRNTITLYDETGNGIGEFYNYIKRQNDDAIEVTRVRDDKNIVFTDNAAGGYDEY